MTIVEAATALERAGHAVTAASGIPGLFDVAGIARDVTSGQLIALAHRHGAWPPAFERGHSAGVTRPR